MSSIHIGVVALALGVSALGAGCAGRDGSNEMSTSSADSMASRDSATPGAGVSELSGSWEGVEGAFYRLDFTTSPILLADGLESPSTLAPFSASVDTGARCFRAPCDVSREAVVGTYGEDDTRKTLTLAGPASPSRSFAAVLGSYIFDLQGDILVLEKQDGAKRFTVLRRVHERAPAVNACKRAGCSGQICVKVGPVEPVTTCEYRPQYSCFESASCELQANGTCGFTMSPTLTNCLSALNESANSPAE